MISSKIVIFLTGEACSTCTGVCQWWSVFCVLWLQKKCTAFVNWSDSHSWCRVHVYCERITETVLYNTYDQNSCFGMSVDFVVVGTWHSGIELHCTVRSVHKQWGQSSINIGMSVGIAVGYCHVTTGNEVLVQASALQSGALRQLISLKKQIMEG